MIIAGPVGIINDRQKNMKTLHLVLFLALVSVVSGASLGVWYDGDKVAPDRPHQKAKQGFGVQLLLTKNESFFTEWLSPTPPKLEVSSTATAGETVYSVLLFFGAGKDKNGDSKVAFSGRVTAPDGKVVQEFKDAIALDGPYSGSPYDLSLSIGYARISMAKEGGKGTYSLEIVVTDYVKKLSIPLVQKIVLI